MRVKINIDTLSKIHAFVGKCANLDCQVNLIDGSGYKVSAKSLVGAIATMDWNQVFVECDKDIYTTIQEFVVI